MTTTLLFRDNAYVQDCQAKVVAITDRGGIVLDQTVFYATSGGQPGDAGMLECGDGTQIEIATTIHDGADKQTIVHVPANQNTLPALGETIELSLNWEKRHAHMRAHTCLHLLCSQVPFPVTGGQIATDGGRLDFMIDDPDAVNKDRLTALLNELIEHDHPVTDRWITDAELMAQPELVRTMSVKPPMNSGKVRLVSIGENDAIDLQPCGGTHVRSTGEIGPVEVTKIENKGKQNRRIRVMFA